MNKIVLNNFGLVILGVAYLNAAELNCAILSDMGAGETGDTIRETMYLIDENDNKITDESDNYITE